MEVKIFTPVQTGCGTHPAFCEMGTGSLSRGKAAGCGVGYPLPSNAEVEERVELYFYSASGPSWKIIGYNLAFYISFPTTGLDRPLGVPGV